MPSNSPTTPTQSITGDRSLGSRVKWLGLFFVTLAAAALSVIYSAQPDFLAPVTMVPCWFWLAALALVICFCSRSSSRKMVGAAIISTLLFGIFFVDEVRSLTRIGKQEIRSTAEESAGSLLRVVTLNCNIGKLKCAREVKELYPDIVMLQESPGLDSLLLLANELYGDAGQVVSSGDTSNLFAGSIVNKIENRESHFTQVTAQLNSGQQLVLVSARLSPPVYRLDFWNQRFWNKHVQSRREHRDQISEILSSIGRRSEDTPTIIAGDFNSVARDGAFTPLGEKFTDAFRAGGRGWGATGTNDFPIFRVDQIWVNEHYVPESVAVRKTKYSDHRMVIGDFLTTDK